MPFAFWVVDLNPFLGPHWGNFGIRYYGLAYVLGFVGGWWLLRRYHRAGRSPFGAEDVSDLMTFLVLGVLVGGRLGYFLLYQPATLWQSPLAFFRVWDGGMASHGGFAGVVIAMIWWSRLRRVPFFQVADLVASTASVGLFFGRIANFINGELWGKSAFVQWAMIFPKSAEPGTPVRLIVPRHPSQLYEAGLEGLALLAYMQWRFWRSDIARTRPGQLSGEFLIGYSLVRMFCELFREPDVGVEPILGLSRGTFYSFFLIAVGIALVVRKPRPT